MEDYEVERKISDLERKVADMEYDLRRATDELRDELRRDLEMLDRRKAATDHSHEG